MPTHHPCRICLLDAEFQDAANARVRIACNRCGAYYLTYPLHEQLRLHRNEQGEPAFASLCPHAAGQRGRPGGDPIPRGLEGGRTGARSHFRAAKGGDASSSD